MIHEMRTTLTLDPETHAMVKRRMRERKVSFKQAVNDAIRLGLASDTREPFETPTADMGLPIVNLDKALQLAADLEDQELVRKQRLGK